MGLDSSNAAWTAWTLCSSPEPSTRALASSPEPMEKAKAPADPPRRQRREDGPARKKGPPPIDVETVASWGKPHQGLWRRAMGDLAMLSFAHKLDPSDVSEMVHQRLTTSACEGCGIHQPTHGIPGEIGRKGGGRWRWCSSCAKVHPGAVALQKKAKCEDCCLKSRAYGMAEERKKRWCSACSKEHPGGKWPLQPFSQQSAPLVPMRRVLLAINEQRFHWLHPGAIMLCIQLKCEDCNVKTPLWGMPSEGKKHRWCRVCAKASHPGAITYVKRNRRMCLQCNLKTASFGIPGQTGETAVRHTATHRGRVRHFCWAGSILSRRHRRPWGGSRRRATQPRRSGAVAARSSTT